MQYMYVVERGKLIAHGVPADVQRHPAVIAVYLGERAQGQRKNRGSEATLAAQPPTPDLPEPVRRLDGSGAGGRVPTRPWRHIGFKPRPAGGGTNLDVFVLQSHYELCD
jgi:hypothetical protein